MNDRVQELKQRLEDLRKRLPAHSIPPAMMAELDDLEELLEREIRQQQDNQPDTIR
ncbi:MAG TPA: histidine kinase [Chloroflexi bacterium]|nr:histidine kinase [Chloroflexota bacterium]